MIYIENVVFTVSMSLRFINPLETIRQTFNVKVKTRMNTNQFHLTCT